LSEIPIREQARSNNADVRQRAAQTVAADFSETDLPLMVEMLGDRDWRVRKTIVDGFLRQPSEQVIRRLIEALHDPENAGKRNSATEALIRMGEQAIPFLIYELGRERDADVRLALVNLLGDLRDEDGYATLVALLSREQDVNLLSSIVASLGKYRKASSIPALLEVLRRDDLWLRFHVIEALGEIGDRTALPAILPLYSEKSLRKPILEAVGKIADVGTVSFLLKLIAQEDKLNLTALRALIRIAEAEKPRVVEQAERRLIQRKFRETFPREKLVPLVEHLYSTPKREVKNFLLKLLGWSADERAVGVLLEAVEDPESAEVASQALVDFGSAAMPAVLDRLRKSDEDEVTAILLKVVHAAGGSEAVPTILTFLDHESPVIRRLAIDCLGEILDPSSFDYLLVKLDDLDAACQQSAVNAICALSAAFPEHHPELLARLRRLMVSRSTPLKLNSLSVYVNVQGEGYPEELLLASKDGDPVIRQRAVTLMGRFGEERFVDQLVLSLADESTAVRVAAINSIVSTRPAKGLEPLISALDDEDIWIRTAAAQAIGEYRDSRVVDALVRHLQADATPVKIAAIEALGKTGVQKAAPVLLGCLSDEDGEVRRAAVLALAKVPAGEVFDRLNECLASGDWRIRAAAASALGIRGDRRALPALHHLLVSDADTYVQQSVVAALHHMPDASSFPYLFGSLQNPAILDDVSELFVRHKEIFRDALEQAWRTADSRQEVVIAAILQAMKEDASRGAGVPPR
jgi:HEAT repeat protein